MYFNIRIISLFYLVERAKWCVTLIIVVAWYRNVCLRILFHLFFLCHFLLLSKITSNGVDLFQNNMRALFLLASSLAKWAPKFQDTYSTNKMTAVPWIFYHSRHIIKCVLWNCNRNRNKLAENSDGIFCYDHYDFTVMRKEIFK